MLVFMPNKITIINHLVFNTLLEINLTKCLFIDKNIVSLEICLP